MKHTHAFIQRALLFFVLVTLLSGCLSLSVCYTSNGEGYCGRQTPGNLGPSDSFAPSNPYQNPCEEGRIFYWEEPGYTCENEAGVEVISYRHAICLFEDGFIQLGDLCSENDFENPLYEGILEELGFSGSLLLYDGGTYQEYFYSSGNL